MREGGPMAETGIVESTLRSWTVGLDPLRSRVSVFERIRDIPYAVVANIKDPVTGPAGLLYAGRGSCTPKHFLLGRMFELLGLRVRYVTYVFEWNDPDVMYPPMLREFASMVKCDFHLNCDALIDGEWVMIDATWDPAVRILGFPVNEAWDGFSNTANAVKPLERIVHETAAERAAYTDERLAGFTGAQMAALEEFHVELNAWLQDLRGAR